MTLRAVGLLGRAHKVVIGAFDVYGELGFGYESLYALALEGVGSRVTVWLASPVWSTFAVSRWPEVDMIVDDKLIVENKSTEHLHPNALPQLFGYLCATDLELGLLLHYGREPKFYRSICENRYKRRS